jgi:hypothetical protein
MAQDDWYDVPLRDDEEVLSPEWLDEVERRVEALNRGAAITPWPEIRDAALLRLSARNDNDTRGG